MGLMINTFVICFRKSFIAIRKLLHAKFQYSSESGHEIFVLIASSESLEEPAHIGRLA